MYFIPNENLDPTLNLAMEQYILSGLNLDEEILFFFIDRPSIIVGRHQNTIDEINLDYVKAQDIQVVRRLSGGGSVYHDLGNLCFSFILPFPNQPVPDFSSFTEPVIRALRKMGVPAEKSGRNDILVEGAKISGNAYYHNKFGTVCHGTLLFNTDLTVLARALNPKPEKLSAKGVQSVRSRVTNLNGYLPGIKTTVEFRERLLSEIARDAKTIELSDADLANAEGIADERYRNPLWTFGTSPKYTLKRTRRFPIGEIELRIEVRDNIIRDVVFFGDFFTSQEIDPIVDTLRGSELETGALTAALRSIDWKAWFSTIQEEDFAAFVAQGD